MAFELRGLTWPLTSWYNRSVQRLHSKMLQVLEHAPSNDDHAA